MTNSDTGTKLPHIPELAAPVSPLELKPGWLQRQFDNLKPFLCMRCGDTFDKTHTCEVAPVSPQTDPINEDDERHFEAIRRCELTPASPPNYAINSPDWCPDCNRVHKEYGETCPREAAPVSPPESEQ